MPKKKIGIINIPPGAYPTIYEKRTADFLAAHTGTAITFLVPRRQPGAKTPDIIMSNAYWEIKCPLGKSSRTIENNLRTASLQSPNIILDIRRIDGRIPTYRHVQTIERMFYAFRSIHRIKIITRDQGLIDLEK